MSVIVRKTALFLAVFLALSSAFARQNSDLFIEWPPKSARNVKVGEPPPLIPRALLFGNPDRTNPKISPDGKRLAWLAPLEGTLNVWVAPVDNLREAKAVTKDTGRGIRRYEWAHTNAHVVYAQDRGGDENWRIYSVRVDEAPGDAGPAAALDLTPFEGVHARIESLSPLRPTEILVALNNRDAQFHDLYVVNIESGERTLALENPGRVGRGVMARFVANDEYHVRFGVRTNRDDGSSTILKPGGGDGEWVEWQQIPQEDALATEPVQLGRDGKTLIMTDSRGRDTSVLLELDVETAAVKVVHAWDSRSDVADWLIHPTQKRVQATAFNHDRRWWRCPDGLVERDLAKMEALGGGHDKCEVKVASRSLDDTQWIVALVTDVGPTSYFHLDRTKGEHKFLFMNRGALGKQPLAPMIAEPIRSRDGLRLTSYLTLPLHTQEKTLTRPQKPLPMVLLVHGGPWTRDSWGYNPLHQLFANRGCAALSVNFRGSAGFGKKFLNAGNREWGGKMHDDLIDAVNWAVAEKIADPSRIAIMGGSYGGYAALVGMTFTPEVFACGVSIVGPSSLPTLLETLPPYWAPMLQMFKDRVGDPGTDEGRKFLLERSPLTHVGRVVRPLLIGQGANDPRVKRAESDQFVRAMEERKIPVTYVVFPDEGHGFARPANSLAFFAVAEAFIAHHLSVEAEPIGDAFKGSTISVPTGADGAPGLSEALPSSAR